MEFACGEHQRVLKSRKVERDDSQRIRSRLDVPLSTSGFWYQNLVNHNWSIIACMDLTGGMLEHLKKKVKALAPQSEARGKGGTAEDSLRRETCSGVLTGDVLKALLFFFSFILVCSLPEFNLWMTSKCCWSAHTSHSAHADARTHAQSSIRGWCCI